MMCRLFRNCRAKNRYQFTQEFRQMAVLRNSSITLLFLTLGVAGFAQSPETTQDASASTGVARRARVPHGNQCWKQAGMTPDMVNQRWHVEDQQKIKIAQVCSESSTSPQQ